MKQYIQKENYETTKLDDEWIILNTDNYTITKLNDVGGFCWTLLYETQTINSLHQAIETEYDLANEKMDDDIETFLSDLIQYGLVEHAV
jgi:hypothetical protein